MTHEISVTRCSGCGGRHRDNPIADVAGAQALDIPAVLIRTKGGVPDALAAAQLVTAG